MTELQKDLVCHIKIAIVFIVAMAGLVTFFFINPTLASTIYAYVFGAILIAIFLALLVCGLAIFVQSVILDYRIRGVLSKEEYAVYENTEGMIIPPDNWPEIKQKIDRVRESMNMPIKEMY